MKTINYTMTAGYRKNWNEIDAVREIVQNCLDNRNDESTYLLSDNGDIEISTKGYKLPTSALAMGQSEKPDGAIGGFGEGFKLALLVLLRAGCDPVVYNGTKVIKPSFNVDDYIGLELFSINVFDNIGDDADALNNVGGLIYKFKIAEDLIDELREKVDVFSDAPMELPEKGSVDILKDKPGKIMTNGLYVCNEDKFRYGYNFAPDMLPLGCDRQLASSFGMSWETSNYWAKSVNEENADEVLDMIIDDCLDVSDIHYRMDAEAAKIVADAFIERFGEVDIKPTGSKIGYGMAVSTQLYSVMRTSGRVSIANEYEEPGTPYSQLLDVLSEHDEEIGENARKALDALLEQSKQWR